jgi:outer membrane protein assembly factor BamC
METDWLENRAAIKQDFIRETVGKVFDGLYTSPEKDRYRTRLEPGAEPGTVEIFISHRGLEEELSPQKDSTTWVWRKPDPSLESEMLRRLMLALGVEEKDAHDLIANAAPSDKTRLESAPDGGMQLSFVEGFDQSWRQIGLALDRAGFIVEDRDRTAGVYDVRLAAVKSGKKEDASWFSKLKFWGKSNDQAQEKPGEPFKVLVKGDDKGSTARVLDKSGNVDKSDAANKMLQLLLEQIK